MGDDARTPVEEPLWKRIILAVPRGFGSLVRSVAGVGEFDPVYRRDGLCFLLIVLAVFFCASEWFRVNGIIGRVLHAFSAGVLGVMSVVLPVLLVIVAIRLMRNSGKNSDNPRVVSGWAILLWSVCSIIDVVVAADARSFDIGLLQRAGGLLGFVLGSPLAWGLSKVFAVIVFVVVGLFSLLMITRTHVTQVPDRVRTIAAMISQRSLHPRQEPDSAAQQDQFPNEVRVGDGDETLAFAEGVPAHDGTDETESDSVGAKGGWFSRLFRRKSAEKTDDASLDRYAGDDPFSHAASRHGQAAETSLDARGNVMPRTVSSTMGAMAGAAAGAMSGAMSGGVAGGPPPPGRSCSRRNSADAIRHGRRTPRCRIFRYLRRSGVCDGSRRGGRECEVGLIDGCRYVRSVGGDARRGRCRCDFPHVPGCLLGRIGRCGREHESQCGRPCACGAGRPVPTARPEHAVARPASCRTHAGQ